MSDSVAKAVADLADLMAVDRATLAALAATGAGFDWHGYTVRIVVRPDCWVEVFDTEQGDMLISMAVPDSMARVLVGEPIGEKQGWRRFTSTPAPRGFYHKANRIRHLLHPSA